MAKGIELGRKIGVQLEMGTEIESEVGIGTRTE